MSGLNFGAISREDSSLLQLRRLTEDQICKRTNMEQIRGKRQGRDLIFDDTSQLEV